MMCYEYLQRLIKRHLWNRELPWAENLQTKVIFVITFASILFLFNLGERDLWAPDEPRYAQVAREMMEGKDFILPHLNGEKYPDKPPVLFWLISLFSLPFGAVTELSARLPSALAGIGCVILTYYLGRRLFAGSAIAVPDLQSTIVSGQNRPGRGEDLAASPSPSSIINRQSPIVNPHMIGFLAALVLSTSIEYLTVSRRVSFDGVLTFLITLSLFCFHTGYMRREGRWRFFLPSYLLMSIATITKGPVGFAIPILVISTFLCVAKFRRLFPHDFRIRDMRIGWGVVIVFSIPLLWVLGLYLHGGWEHTKEVVFTQNLGRTVDSWSHKQPFYYFFAQFPAFFAPWIIFVPSVVIYCIKTFRSGLWQPPILFPSIWFVAVFTFFSIMSCKRSTYILPLYPAASILVAWFLSACILSPADKTLKRLGYLPLWAVYGLLIIVGFGFPVWVYRSHHEYVLAVLPMTIVFIIGQVVAMRYLSLSRPFNALLSFLVIMLITVMLCTVVVVPIVNQEKSARAFCERANEIMGIDGRLSSFNYFGAAYLFYTGRRHIPVINDTAALKEYMDSDGKVYLLLRVQDLEGVKRMVDSELYVLAKDSIGHRTILLVSNRSAIDG